MSYQILGRAVKNEHLALGILTTAFGGAFLAMSGGKKDAKPVAGQSLKDVKASVPFNAGSSEEEQLMESIRKFVADAEKEESAASAAAKH